MDLRRLPRHRASRGVSLVELMVGVAIGLIGIVAIFQAVTVWTKHTQTTSSGGDAQVAGTLALFNIERNLKQAGHGFGQAANTIMGCNAQNGIAAPINLRPVEIIAGVPAGSPDAINVFAGGSQRWVSEGDFTNSVGTTKRVPRPGSFRVGDVAVVAGAVPAGGPIACMMIGITTAPDAAGWMTHVPGAAFPDTLNIAAPPAFLTGKIYNLGPRPSYDVWTIDPNRNILQRRDSLAAAPAQVQIADGVVNMKAEYGYDADGNGIIAPAEWVAVLPAPPAMDWTRVLAVRVAVLVRGRQFERSPDPGATGTAAVTPTAQNPRYFADPGPARNFLMRNIDGTADGFGDANVDPNNWRYYRYRVYERVIPLRNMLWGVYG